ncbi:type II secretion system F family protein [Rhodopirellula baltica]|uniref:type II secretion system F family protein n=1 Tax=Rhodopirellula baltica TaxID=265606 RepID=UPI001F40F03D|nr:type II secretion system F family protein [Rhodopirellula baltica]
MLWSTSVIALASSAPHPITFVLLAMMIGSLFVARRWTYREEAESLNRWMRLAVGTRASYPVLAESLANSSSSRIAFQGKTFSARLMRGESLVNAVRRSKLPITADTLAAIQHPQATTTTPDSFDNKTLRSPLRQQQSIDAGTPVFAPIVAEQLIYLIATMFLAWGLGYLIRGFIAERFEYIAEEFFDIDSNINDMLQTIMSIYEGVMILVSIWFVMVILIRWQPAWLTRWTPWFGKDSIARWRCEILCSLSIGMRSEHAESELLTLASQSSRNRWIQKRCRKASRLIENGTTLPVALRSSQIVTAKEQSWLTSAANNHHLPSAIDQLVDNISRRRSLTWKVRMSWLIPLAIVAVGIYVIAHIVTVFLFLTKLTTSIS